MILLTMEEVAKRRQISWVRLAQLTKQGRLPGPDVQAGRYRFYSPELAEKIVYMVIEDRRKTRHKRT